jgi:hypothetical protein
LAPRLDADRRGVAAPMSKAKRFRVEANSQSMLRARSALGRTLSFDFWLSNVHFRFLSPGSRHSAPGQLRKFKLARHQWPAAGDILRRPS